VSDLNDKNGVRPHLYKKKTMNPIQNLHYAIGQIAYAVAMADGEVQKSERQKFHDIIAAELRNEHHEFDISGIIFQILDKDKQSTDNSFEWALNQIKANGHYLSPKLKTTFIRVIEKIAHAFPPKTDDERKVISDFMKEIEGIHGDPVYYALTDKRSNEKK
jgi:uncharacterized tellurite resistance protein B-like protein